MTAALLGAASVPCVAAYRHAHAPLPVPPPLAESAAWARVDQGAEFDRMAPGPHLRQVSFNGDGVGVAVGTMRRMWRTTDGGRSWGPPTGLIPVQWGVRLLDDGRGFVVGGAEAEPLWVSLDAGESWTRSDVTLRSPRGGTALVAWVLDAGGGVLILGGERAIGRSADGGRSWTPLDVPPQEYYGAASSGSTVLVVGGSGFVLRSTDRGATWHEQTLESRAMLRGVAFADPSTAVIVGTDGTILRSQDAGLTWAEVPSPTPMHLSGIAFADAGSGVIVGFHGTALLTRDGGRSWELEESGTRNHLSGVALAPDGSPVAVGWFDTIIRRASLLQDSVHGD